MSSQVKVTLFTVPDMFTVFVWRGLGENEVELTWKAEIGRLEALAVGKGYAMQGYAVAVNLV